MSRHILKRSILLSVICSALSLAPASAQSRKGADEKTWASAVKGKAVSVEPIKLKLLVRSRQATVRKRIRQFVARRQRNGNTGLF